jgi:hypothetical protein
VELTGSWHKALPQSVRDRYDVIETRNAAAVLSSTNPEQFNDICEVLDAFGLTNEDILVAGGNETMIAGRLNRAFKRRGWQEERAVTTVRSYMQPRGADRNAEDGPVRAATVSQSNGYFIDNVKGRVVLDVEWNAKDGNLDRDLGMYRWLYDVAFIDVAVMLTREHDELRDFGVKVRLEAGQEPRVATTWLKTTTTTNLQKLVPRLRAGNAGGCPFLGLAITHRTWKDTT